VRHATAHSPFYRELYGETLRGEVELERLPVVTKTAMMASFDRFVTDRRLRRDDLLAHIAAVRGDERWQGEYRVMASSGSSGARAIYVYDRAAWRGGFLTGSLRMAGITGLRPRLPRPKLATVAAADGTHMTFRGGASMDVGLYRAMRFSASAPLAQLAAELQAYRPDFLLGYPSVLALLADEQRAGRLRIAPSAVTTSSEVCTPAMAASIREAWGKAPFNCLGLTETGITAVDCDAHAGLHVFEDLCILEAVDECNRPVPPRTPGAKILVTNLFNRVQPIIRFEVSDLVTLDDAPCSCGRTLQRIVALDGRSDDILELSGPNGRVLLHPIHLRSVLGVDPAVLQYQVTLHQASLDVHVVLAEAAPPGVLGQITGALRRALIGRGADVAVTVRAVAVIPRENGPGKLKLVRVLHRDAR
jgi:phenylacetate-CoA ligase